MHWTSYLFVWLLLPSLVQAAEPVVATLAQHKEIHCIHYAPDGRLLLTCDRSGTIRVWNTAGYKLLWNTQAQVTSRATFSPDSKILASAMKSGKVRLWDARSGSTVADFSIDGYARRIAFFPDGKQIIVGMEKGRLEVRGMQTYQVNRTWRAGSGGADEILVSHNGKFLVTREVDLPLRFMEVWETTNWEKVSPDLSHLGFSIREGGECALAILPDGDSLLVPSTRCPSPRCLDAVVFVMSLKQWNATKVWRPTRSLEVRLAQEIDAMALSFDAKALVVATCFDPRKVRGGSDFNSSSHQLPKPQDLPAHEKVEAPLPESPKLAPLPPPPRRVPAKATNDVCILDVQTGKEIVRLTDQPRPLTCIAISPDGKHLATGDSLGTIKIWDVSALSATEEEKGPHDQ